MQCVPVASKDVPMPYSYFHNIIDDIKRLSCMYVRQSIIPDHYSVLM